jgi:L-threonylcarbamoyladenylate synthase
MTVQDAAKQLQLSGVVGVIPTDTVYGIVARANDQVAVARLYRLKHRENKPGTVIAASVDQLVDLGLTRRYLKAVEQFWPDSISVIIPCGPELAYIHQDKLSLAVRIPKDDALRQLLEQTGALLTSSANQPGETPAATIDQAKAYFGEQVDFYLDGGDLTDRQPSTVIRVIDDAIEVVRPGAVTIDESGRKH